MKRKPADRLITVHEAAVGILGVPETTLRRWVKQGLMDAILDPRGRIRFSEKYLFAERERILRRKFGEKK